MSNIKHSHMTGVKHPAYTTAALKTNTDKQLIALVNVLGVYLRNERDKKEPNNEIVASLETSILYILQTINDRKRKNDT